MLTLPSPRENMPRKIGEKPPCGSCTWAAEGQVKFWGPDGLETRVILPVVSSAGSRCRSQTVVENTIEQRTL